MTDPLLQQRLVLFPDTTEIVGEGSRARLAIGGCDLAGLAEQYGTPLYVFDGATLDAAAQSYADALGANYPSEAGITYAGKAFLNRAVARWAHQRGLWVDCTGVGEIAVAVAAGVPREQLLVHGVSKSVEDLAAAVEHAGVIVVDNLGELQRLSALWTLAKEMPDIWLRVRPGVAVDTHAYRQTGQSDSKFGMDPQQTLDAVLFCQAHGLPLAGIHFHQGSHFHDPAPIAPALATVLDLIEEVNGQSGWVPRVLSPGGGWGVAYHEDDLPHPTIEEYVAYVAQQLVVGCRSRNLPLPRLQLEPGRSIVARAGVAIYRVGSVKRTPNRRWLLLDGGMADNPRPALYGARYSALPVVALDRLFVGPACLAGPYCESGDVLIEGLPMPDLAVDELIAVPVSGAYHLAMGSNYNGARKPAVLWLRGGEAHVIQRRETVADLMLRDVELPE
jgi:diaminopimelate decarboxylase